jgi:ribosome-associated protein
MDTNALVKLVVEALEDMKATDIKVIDVRAKTGFTDIMVFASGSSDRQVKSLVNSVVVKAKENGVTPLGVEGEREGEWALVDLADVVVHVMLPRVRDFYQLERLWNVDEPAAARE